jgi:hypothetical protein
MLHKLVLTVLVLSSGLSLAACTGDKPGLSVKSIHPSRGPYLGGDPVTISTTGFSSTIIDSIRFGKSKARPPIVKENGDLIVEPPGGTANQTVDIEIILNDARTIKIPGAYTYIDPTAPAGTGPAGSK